MIKKQEAKREVFFKENIRTGVRDEDTGIMGVYRRGKEHSIPASEAARYVASNRAIYTDDRSYQEVKNSVIKAEKAKNAKKDDK
jgi:hypothetical protein